MTENKSLQNDIINPSRSSKLPEDLKEESKLTKENKNRYRGINSFQTEDNEIQLEEDENQDIDMDDSNPNRLSLREKISLSDRVKLLANDGLASLVRLVQKECPASIDDLDEENLQIKLNKLEKKTYEQINQ
jgi:hypothetical protein